MRESARRRAPTIYRGDAPLWNEAVWQQGGWVAELYHRLLTASWPGVLAFVASLFIVLNALFGLIYFLDGGLQNARTFSDAFFFSVETIATIGYGQIAPASMVSNVTMTIEAFTGLIGLATVTGLIFAKFSRPSARVRFSRIAVVSLRDGVPSLMFRMANLRGNWIVDATAHVVLARQEHTKEGEEVRRFFDLHLVRDRNPIFNYSWTAVHPVHENSPFHGHTVESLKQVEAEVIVSITGLDVTFAQTIHARHSYRPDDIVWNARLADVLMRKDNRLTIDYSRFDDYEPAP